jgi:hypothetical protein
MVSPLGCQPALLEAIAVAFKWHISGDEIWGLGVVCLSYFKDTRPDGKDKSSQ